MKFSEAYFLLYELFPSLKDETRFLNSFPVCNVGTCTVAARVFLQQQNFSSLENELYFVSVFENWPGTKENAFWSIFFSF